MSSHVVEAKRALGLANRYEVSSDAAAVVNVLAACTHALLAIAERLEMATETETSCRVCGCTDDTACPGGCSWAQIDPEPLCSRCIEKGSANRE